jgi:hypothetical protein
MDDSLMQENDETLSFRYMDVAQQHPGVRHGSTAGTALGRLDRKLDQASAGTRMRAVDPRTTSSGS